MKEHTLFKDDKVSYIPVRRRALVAGGAGFVGCHLCHRLINDGYEVICVDNLCTGRLENIADLMSEPVFSFLHHDIVDALHVSGVINEIYNLACPASPIQYQKDPIHTFKTSVMGSMNLLELAKEKRATILLASTSEVYGDAMVSPQNESYWGNVNPCGLRSCYDEGKRGAETLFHDYHKVCGVNTRIIRIFNTYGPRMSDVDGRVVSNFITQALCGRPLTIYGDGSQTRSFMYIDDLVEALVRAMGGGIPSAPMNIGNPRESTVLELAETVLRLTESTSAVTYCPLPSDDPHQRKPDIRLAMRLLGSWQPKVCLEDGLQRTIKYYKEEYTKHHAAQIV